MEYWYFIVAGIILLALITYWIIESVSAKKAREKRLQEFSDTDEKLQNLNETIKSDKENLKEKPKAEKAEK